MTTRFLVVVVVKVKISAVFVKTTTGLEVVRFEIGVVVVVVVVES